jgi:hypothetical protein
MKRKIQFGKPSPVVAGAGLGLMVVCIIVMLIDPLLSPAMLMFNAIGLLMATGVIGGEQIKDTRCSKYSKTENPSPTSVEIDN